jgi:hypothetical protein
MVTTSPTIRSAMARERTITLRPTLVEWILIMLAALQPLAARAYWAAALAGCVAGIGIGVWRIVKILGYQLEHMQAADDQEEVAAYPPPGQRVGTAGGPSGVTPDGYGQ